MTRYLYWLPLAVVLMLCAKNGYYFDSFGTSSWLAHSAYKTTLWQLPQAERDSLYDTGTISVFATQEPFARVWHYGVPVETCWEDRVAVYPNTPHRQVPVLDVTEFPDNGSNLNHWTYLVIADSLKDDVRWAITHRPDVFLKMFLTSAGQSLMPGHRWFVYAGHHGRRRHNLDVLAQYYQWINTEEWSSPNGQ